MAEKSNLTGRDRIVQGLIAERDTIREEAEDRMATLQAAIDLLSEQESQPAVQRNPPRAAADKEPAAPKLFKPSVVQMCKKVIADFPNDKIFDVPTLKPLAIAAFPGYETKIKTGIYVALTALKEKGQIKLAPGGFLKTETFSLP
jgi:hypothetical protein